MGDNIENTQTLNEKEQIKKETKKELLGFMNDIKFNDFLDNIKNDEKKQVIITAGINKSLLRQTEIIKNPKIYGDLLKLA